jgi:multiple sugar transport system substrate-binding protein
MNDKNKKVFIIGGIVLVVLLMITALILLLNKDNPNNNGNTTQNAELTYWGLWEPDSVMQPLIDAYETLNPGVNILYSQQSFSNYESRLYTRLQQATTSSEPAPDIFRIHNTWTPKYYTYLSPMPSNVYTASEYADIFYPTAVSDFTAKDLNIYAVPIEIDGLVVFYNKQLLADAGFTEPPTDWDSFMAAAQELTEKDSSGKIEVSGLAMGASRNIEHSAEILSFLFIQEGLDLIDSTYTTVTLNTTKAEAVLDTYVSFAQGENATWSADLRTDLEMFYSGDLAMMIAPSWRAFDIITAAPNIEFDTAPLPQLTANSSKIYYSSYWGEAVSKTSSNQAVAWDFIKYLSQKEQQQQLYSNSSQIRAFGEPYSLQELNSAMEGKTYVSAIAEMAPYMTSWSMGDETTVKTNLNEAITAVLENGTDADQALRKAQENINEQLATTNL